MNRTRLNDELARLLGWKLGPDRYVQPERRWIPKWRFNPFSDSDDAFSVVSKLADRFTLSGSGVTITAQVEVGTKVGRASARTASSALTIALLRALDLKRDGTEA